MDVRQLIACHECDLIHKRHQLGVGETACCCRCGASLYSEKADVINRGIALNLTALILYLIAISLPFLGINANGIEVSISLFQSVSALYFEHMKLMSLVVCLVLLIAPAVRIFGMLFILVPLKFNHTSKAAKVVFRMVELAGPWNMVEIFLIGILVTFVKLAGLASIILGVSFWAFICMVVVITISNVSIDKHQFWDVLEHNQ